MQLRSAIAKIKKRGILLVFPVNNRKEPASLWSEFFPRSEMRWEWDQEGDTRVSDLWFLREKLSRSRQVVYTKWYRGRAAVLSLELFKALVKVLNPEARRQNLSFPARDLLDALDEDSPLSTKALKRASGLEGRENERVYERSMKELWSQLLIVGFGEVDEGAFPSLAIASSKVIFEELWQEAYDMDLEEAQRVVDEYLPSGSLFRKFLESLLRAKD